MFGCGQIEPLKVDPLLLGYLMTPILISDFELKHW